MDQLRAGTVAAACRRMTSLPLCLLPSAGGRRGRFAFLLRFAELFQT
jgi:hypothetical protein